jgi:hypothetical protein
MWLLRRNHGDRDFRSGEEVLRIERRGLGQIINPRTSLQKLDLAASAGKKRESEEMESWTAIQRESPRPIESPMSLDCGEKRWKMVVERFSGGPSGRKPSQAVARANQSILVGSV